MKTLIILLLLPLFPKSQDSIKVKIKKVFTNVDGYSIIKMKDVDNKIRYFTTCKCEIEFKEGEVLRIKNPVKTNNHE